MPKTIRANDIFQALQVINQPLYSVEERIRDQARTFDPAVEGYVAYAIASRGKRLRPALALLAGGCTGEITSGHVDLAVITELIHLATLVHDDIIDGAEIRRELPTANAKWGCALSVLLGDVLFAHALKLSTFFHDSEVSRHIAQAASAVCQGEIIQTQRRFDLTLSVPDYFRIIEMKTAALFAVAAELGAFINNAPQHAISGLKTFGIKLGTAYQIYDDIIDIAGDEESAGKSLGTDLAKGKLTLPILDALKLANPRDREHLRTLILDNPGENTREVRSLVQKLGGMKSAIRTASTLCRDGRRQLLLLEENPHREALLQIAGSLEATLQDFN